MRLQPRPALAPVCLALALPLGLVARAEEPPTFEREVRPILKAYCLDCHGGAKELKGGLDLRLKRFAVTGGKSGPAIEPGNVEESLLLARVHDGEMPPGEKKVPAEQVAILEKWIAAGAPTSRDEPESLPPGIDITPEERAYWAYQPIRRPSLPAFGAADRVRTPIDALLLVKLRERGLGFAPDADRATLIRRLSFDLTGLPPSEAEVEAFVRDTRPDAYEQLVERLLASPAYGERWARHWLDVAGFADSEGNGSEDTLRPYASKYRDYVVRALNADKPLDQFVIEQMAGDELVPRPWANLTPEQIDTLAATGFLRNAADPTATGAPDEALASNQVVADTLKIVGSSLLGLTVGCAQCHDHRYDPIPQEDYFRLRAVFEPALDPQHWRRPGQRLISLYTDEERARAQAIEAEAQAMQKVLDEKTSKMVAEAVDKELMKYPEDLRAKLRAALDAAADKRTDEQKALLASNPSVNISPGVLYQYNEAAANELKKDAEKIAAKRAEKTVEDFVSVLDEIPGSVPETRLFYRGDHRQPLDPVGPGDLTIAAPDGARVSLPAKDPNLPTSGRRLAYARHLMNGKHPLVGRVLANRIWMHHFGRGIVDTPGDLGALGTRPTHPEVLDWMADELPAKGWSLKALHRAIVTSTAYRQSSRVDSPGMKLDELDALYGRYPVRRLDAEVLRDRVLAASGRIDRAMYGPSVPVSEDTVGQVLPANGSTRRSLYLQSRRTKPVSLLAAFDAPAMTVNCDRRISSVSPMQSLVLMNSDFVIEQAKELARRVIAETATEATINGATPDPADRPGRLAARAWMLAYQRAIEPDELELARAYLAEQAGVVDAAPADRELVTLANLCQQLLSSNEFLHVD